MIKNIIFDLGNVLLSWKPGEFFERSGYGPEEIRIILKDIFKSNEWSMLDNGDITTSEAIDLIASGSSLKRASISAIFDLRTKVIFPLVKNIKLLPELNKEGFKLYYLSNFPLDFFEEVKKQYDFFKYFNGGIISAEVGCSKPDTGIFEIFLEKYNLAPEDCLYIDDIEINVRVAESFGMKGIHLARTDSLEKKLMESGLRIASLRSQ
jgi:putative hydrolase of the HAD superfamily